MATSLMKLFAIAFLVFMLVLSTGTLAEARICESKSNHFKGPCVSDTNCASVCKGERFTGGKCRGFRRRCFCTKNC